MKTRFTANAMLLMVTIFWGFSYLFMKMGLNSLQEYNLIALRFGIAFFLAAAIFPIRLLKANTKTIRYAFILGLILFLVFSCIIFGIKYTSTSNAAFLVSLTVIFVPILTSLIVKKLPEISVIVGVSFALLGVGLLTLNSQLIINFGDLLCIAGALLYATHIIVTEKLTKAVDSIALGIMQLGFAGSLGFIFSLLLETPRFPITTVEWLPILVLSILCSAIGFIVQTVAQQHTTSTNTGLIFSLEPVFAALFAFLFLGETLSIQGWLGAILVLLGVIHPQLNLYQIRTWK
ncbi:DMT family transporter [Pelosinus propionicus]|uniref:Threonine/homoserine efflux transporter RhtA n=1 Tax=Pelosinus propionicus DSM 13327 TaxID=1123291 RepID=A0A1I4GYZ5_9FIRM|nr:DMT family transporter [Pelosinus propionicus]SFL34577.1 Threonine/homoserine efflux transporter RhtA [Pelosinus propionicus DSM 13327]